MNLKEKLKDIFQKLLENFENKEEEKEALEGKEYLSKNEINLLDTFTYKNLWKDLCICVDNKFFNVNPEKVIIDNKGDVFFQDKEERLYIGKIEDTIYYFNNLNDKYEKINVDKFCTSTEFIIKGVKLTQYLKEKLDNKFFINVINMKRGVNING